MFSIKNESIKITVSSKGAELQSIINCANGQEYMWSGDPAYWGKHSPVLFPIVGTLKNNTYYFDNKTYHIPRHGFARDMEFDLHEQSPEVLSLRLKSNVATLKIFPFEFEFYIIYQLLATGLKVTYQVINTNNYKMFFSVGGHPAFKLPLFYGDAYTDYILEFSNVENAKRWPITGEGLIDKIPVPLLNNERALPLKKELFYKDAIVLKCLNSHAVKLVSQKSGKGFEFDFTGFPFLGIWAAKDADFICIEPWCGIADGVAANQQLTEKEGICVLNAGEIFNRTWTFTFID